MNNSVRNPLPVGWWGVPHGDSVPMPAPVGTGQNCIPTASIATPEIERKYAQASGTPEVRKLILEPPLAGRNPQSTPIVQAPIPTPVIP